MSKILVTEYLPDEYLELLRTLHDVEYDPDLCTDRGRLLDRMSGVEALFTRNRTRVDDELLASGHDLRVVGRLGVGLDNIDMNRCEQAGVLVISALGENAVSVAEYAIGAMLVLIRGVYGMTSSMVAGEWPRQGHAFGHELMGKTLGLVGFGSIARQVATRAAGLGMEVIAHDPFVPADDAAWTLVRNVDLESLLGTSDVISVHVPLSDDTRNLIDEPALARMKPTAILINTSRGGIVDETALADALLDGKLGGAALDVFASEPLGPEPAAVFATVPNLLLTPHVAGNTRESVDRVARTIVEQVMTVLAG
ncbi:MAG: (S)-sulfolactate dehydrogenase [Acidimicrobiia bacterium]|nr:(S)-sulfolactate dehydrogenase [Acidimicrobiia bacterium]